MNATAVSDKPPAPGVIMLLVCASVFACYVQLMCVGICSRMRCCSRENIYALMQFNSFLAWPATSMANLAFEVAPRTAQNTQAVQTEEPNV